jgi:hypothetical protein
MIGIIHLLIGSTHLVIGHYSLGDLPLLTIDRGYARVAVILRAALSYMPLDQNLAGRYTCGDFLGLCTIGEA